jgi:hypothetical protein
MEFVFAFVPRDVNTGSAKFFKKLGFQDPGFFEITPYSEDADDGRDYTFGEWLCQRFPDLIANIDRLCPLVTYSGQVRFRQRAWPASLNGSS